jgi:hypothetical protein
VYARARLRESLTLTRDSFPKPGSETKRAVLPKTLNKANYYSLYSRGGILKGRGIIIKVPIIFEIN